MLNARLIADHILIIQNRFKINRREQLTQPAAQPSNNALGQRRLGKQSKSHSH